MDYTAIITAVIAFAGTLIGTLAGISRSTTLTTYKIDELTKKVNEHNKRLIEEVEKYKDMQGSFNKAILVAEDASNQIKKMAKDEYKSIVDEAKKNASRIVNEALLRANKIESDSEELRRKVILLKRRLRQEIESSLESIEDIGEN